MTIRLVGSSSGYTEIDAPAVAGSNTLTLPTGNGTSGQYLQTNGSGVLSWAAAGKILQVVNVAYSTAASSASATYADTGLTATITPSSSSSKVLVVVHHNGCAKINNTFMGVKLLRGSTDIAKIEESAGYTNSAAANRFGSISIEYLDSPATTSATTYKTQFNADSSIATVFLQINSAVSTMTLLEVAA